MQIGGRKIIELTPFLNKESNIPLYMQLVDFIKQEILSGNIRPGEKLPSKRKLAEYLGLSINTIQSAYEQLTAESYAESRPRKGIFVADFKNDLLPETVLFHQQLHEKAGQENEQIKIDFNSDT
ncbi:GntR family transcriptional regulator [Weizmannia acidilactici]|uniref:GntR family transcriptional regulator n=1 Tax=Weizmannia acidilactici TaxID=2607726 RepID=UPI00127BD77E|nr:winged helix-turn-helix domain-containing protein [Weizmannia acidilactici]GER66546.1 hypothetical protein BpJC4_10170 [Weizmannia acidilactici]GER74566.1 hypothetical protein BpPP18_26330 [Weizmannia acidilactici]